MKYDEKVEKISAAIHESWMRSRNTIMKRYPDCARDMHARWDKDMVPYNKLPWVTQEYDRMEARENLAMIGKLPLYTTRKERKAFKSCIYKNKVLGMDEATIKCFRDMKLQCLPVHRVYPNKDDIYC